jgi:hypothetical protein
MMKVLVGYFVIDTHKVMTTCLLPDKMATFEVLIVEFFSAI